MTLHPLGWKGAQALEGRGLSVETAVRYEIYTAKRGETGELEPDENGNVVAFPFVEHGAVVAEKYRAPGKRFWQRAGGRRTFWNSDALDDPALENGTMALVITEGEIDALTAIECGFPLTVSVPDGAPAVPQGEQPDALQPVDPDKESSGKFEFVWNNRDRLKRVKRFILAVDSDPPGMRLAAELVRRLSAARCLFVSYPEGCKDLNDVLTKHSREAVTAVLNGARPYPVKGLYKLSDYPPGVSIETFSTGWPNVDAHMKLFAGEFMVVTGIPNHGKSTLVTNMLVNLAEDYRWRSAIFSPEMPVVTQYRDKIRRMRLRRTPADMWEEDDADRWIDEYFRFIDSDPVADLSEDVDIDWVLDRATDAVLRDGIRVLVIDPWNELDHARRRDESMPDYIGRAIRVLKRFAKRHQVAVIVVAHPTKEVGKDGKGRMPTPYDIDGAAHWYNKPDHILVIHRPDEATNDTMLRIAKVRFEETGSRGHVLLRFDPGSSRFEMPAGGYGNQP